MIGFFGFPVLILVYAFIQDRLEDKNILKENKKIFNRNIAMLSYIYFPIWINVYVAGITDTFNDQLIVGLVYTILVIGMLTFLYKGQKSNYNYLYLILLLVSIYCSLYVIVTSRVFVMPDQSKFYFMAGALLPSILGIKHQKNKIRVSYFIVIVILCIISLNTNSFDNKAGKLAKDYMAVHSIEDRGYEFKLNDSRSELKFISAYTYDYEHVLKFAYKDQKIKSYQVIYGE